MTDLDAVQQRLGLDFRRPDLLRHALTHRSSLNENPDITEDNERLEFLGDAVIDFITTTMLFDYFPELDEGELTRLRSTLVCTEQLSNLARSFNLGDALLLGRGEAETGGRERDALLCAAFEAMVGALYLDAGVQAVSTFLEPLLLHVAQETLSSQNHVDAKSRLQEWAQSALGKTPHYATIDESGPDHSKNFTVEVVIGKQRYGIGSGCSKRQAEQAAACSALYYTDAGGTAPHEQPA